MKHIAGSLCCLLLVLGSQASAQVFHPYYGQEFFQERENDEALKRRLHRVLKDTHQQVPNQADKIVNDCDKGARCYQHESLSYNQAKSFLLSKYYVVSQGQGYAIRDVYCEVTYSVPGPHAVPNPNILNIEHTWPQSRFTQRYDKNVQKADMHHLYPTDSEINSVRGNLPFGEVDQDEGPLKCPVSKRGIPKGSTDTVFEPPPVHRGNVARALFYFSIRYEISIDEQQEQFLRQWHQADPVDEEELRRNEEIFKAQGNRNPFVDYPELTSRIKDF